MQDQGVGRLVPPEASLIALKIVIFSVCLPVAFLLCVHIPGILFYKDNSYIKLWPHLTEFNLLFKSPISKYSHTGIRT